MWTEKITPLGNVHIENNLSENVYSFEYLGGRLQGDGDDEADVRYRMDIAQAAFTSLFRLWTNCHRIIVLIRNYELLIRIYELLIRNYELVIRNYELVISNYEFRNRPHCQVQGDHIIVQSICAPKITSSRLN